MNNNGTDNGWAATVPGQHIQQQLQQERTLEALDKILQRVETLETAVERHAQVMEQGPGMVSMVADMADEGYQQAAARGVDVQERLGVALALAEKLTAPQMVEQLNGLLSLADQAPGLAAMMADMVDEGYHQAAQRGVNINERLSLSLQAAERLTSPAMLNSLNQLISLSEQAPGLVAMTMDIVDTEYSKLSQEVDLAALAKLGGALTHAAAEAANAPTQKLGLFGLMKALGDPDRQKALGFLMNLTKELGKQL